MTIVSDTPLIDGPDVVVIKPRRGWLALEIGVLWKFRDLFMAFGARDVRLRYRQTFLGVSWVILQPLLGDAPGLVRAPSHHETTAELIGELAQPRAFARR